MENPEVLRLKKEWEDLNLFVEREQQTYSLGDLINFGSYCIDQTKKTSKLG